MVAEEALRKADLEPGSAMENMSLTLQQFEGYAPDLARLEASGCQIVYGPRFRRLLASLKDHEAARVAAEKISAERQRSVEAAENAEAAKAAAAETARRDAVKAEAKKHGLRIVYFDWSLSSVLAAVVSEALPMKAMRLMAIQPGPVDDGFTAAQIIDDNTALFVHQQTGQRIFVTAFKGSIYEGTALPVLQIPYWKITGTRSYTNVMGAMTEAFVVAPAW